MNLKEIKEMINLMNENDLGELEVEREGAKIKIKKSCSSAPVISSVPPLEVRNQSIPPVNINASPNIVPEQKSSKNVMEITSPMVGTMYRAPSPEALPFVEVGQVVEIGQVVCIVEAMKLMNEIKSEVKGKVVEIAAENAEPVEFGQTLFVLEPV
ncbi:MAG: acetyl-CoA carboxylase biotin carboxyl carrier protein [Candidatus Omnitrophota bacterium]